jgi:hypothetical protein
MMKPDCICFEASLYAFILEEASMKQTDKIGKRE